MKNTFKLLLIFFTISVTGQTVGTTAGIDVFNAIRGGKVLKDGTQRNGRAIDYRGRFFFGTPRVEIGLSMEIFPEIDFYSQNIDLNYVFPAIETSIFDIKILTGLEASLVRREENFSLLDYRYLNWGANTRVRIQKPKETNFFAEIQFNVNHRNDIIELWGRNALPSGTLPALWSGRSLYLSIGYYFN